MQYTYEILDKFGGSDIFIIRFNYKNIGKTFLEDLFLAIKELEPNIININDFLYDYRLESIAIPFDCSIYGAFDLEINTNIGQLELTKEWIEDAYINADRSQECIIKINELLSKDINFHRIN